MPTSLLHAFPHVLRFIKIAQPSTILECDMGFSRLGFLLREHFSMNTWPPNTRRYRKKSVRVGHRGLTAWKASRR